MLISQGIEPHPGPEGEAQHLRLYDALHGQHNADTAPSSVVMEVLQVSHFPTHLEQVLARDADVMLIGEHSMTPDVAENHQAILAKGRIASSFSGLDPELRHNTGGVGAMARVHSQSREFTARRESLQPEKLWL